MKIEKVERESAAPPKPRRMRLPKNSMYPNYNESHIQTDWCSKVGCRPICDSPKDTLLEDIEDFLRIVISDGANRVYLERVGQELIKRIKLVARERN